MSSELFSIVDTETTGLFPGGNDRIAEIAVVTMTRSGEVVEKWETLVNPQRDLGKQTIHGIQSRDLLNAPTFKEVAEELHWRLSGTVLVAHNLSFDARFLQAEFRNSSKPVPDEFLNQGICTMRLSHRYLQGAGRSLQDCCDSFGIELLNSHSAAGDAVATATLLARYMELDPYEREWDTRLQMASANAWNPSRPQSHFVPVIRRSSHDKSSDHFLEKLATQLPEFEGTASEENYLALLDLALMDRYLSAHEEKQLIQAAGEIGLDRNRALALHEIYFRQLVDAAWSDGILTDDEISDLKKVVTLLGLPAAMIEAVPDTPTKHESEQPTSTGQKSARITPGSLVVLTGDMSQPRSEIEKKLNAAGFTPHRAITKKVALLVAADPDSLSGKAKKARDYGIPVVGEDYLWNSLL
ncbi:exonuclease domain-containing protein [Glutamicibacter sp. JC586]|uniref:exonuclease domain-containing protein n=1 Tax=Glutamicibacter sp. JC586 TaxID=2590552 RepID=UPI0013579874|nr:exonuclease domain-containing protein [Glutamicibacter sp. JC586]